jgi:DNA-binding transcriptional LysR family regulator
MEAPNLNRLAYFVAVVDAGSFTRAGERLGITKAVVSQQVMRLEEELKTSLLVRTTRRVEPTEAGRLFYARCSTILQDVGQAFAAVAESGAKPTGVLRVAAPNDFGTSVLAGIAADFSRRHPECQVELLLGDERIDLVAQQIDLSIRVGWLDDSSLQARRIGSFQQCLVASPEVAEHITASTPSALSSAPFVANSALRNPLDWQFSRGRTQRQALSMRPRLTINSTPAVLAAVLAGGGVSILPDYLVAAPLRTGRLVQLLPDWMLPPGGIHAVFPASRYRPMKTSAFIEFIVQRMAGGEPG